MTGKRKRKGKKGEPGDDDLSDKFLKFDTLFQKGVEYRMRVGEGILVD